MTNEIANYDEELAKLAKRATAVEKPTSSSIGVRAGVLTYNGTAVPGNKLDCIIIASTHANLFYEDKFDSNNPKNPVCYAYCDDPDNEEMVPHPKASKPQCDNCNDCWANAWGSDLDGGRGKACKNVRRLAILPSDVQPEDLQTAEVATLTLPVMSVSKKWSPYVHKLATLYNKPPLAMRTVISTQPDQKAQFLVTFDDAGPVDVSLLGGLIAKAKSVDVVLKKEYDANPEPTEEDKAAAAKSKARGKKF
jgi:hypothetical protein